MRLLALVGSLALFIYIVAVVLLSFHNFSRTLFGHTFEKEAGTRYWMRQIMIMLWPLAIASEEGRYALYVIWTGRDDKTPPGREDLKP
jgi:hypothetical protein